MDTVLSDILGRVQRLEIRARSPLGDLGAGVYRSRFRGTGMEFDQVREYMQGDDIRHIDWNVTARSQRTHVKTFKEERELSVMLLVDCSGAMACGGALPGSQPKYLAAAEAAATIAVNALRSQDRVGIIGFTDRTEFHHPAAKGRNHMLRFLRDLLAIEHRPVEANLARAVKEYAAVSHRRGICIIISDFLSELGDLSPALERLSRRHEILGLRITDPAEMELPGGYGPLLIADPGSRSVRHLECSSSGRARYLELLNSQRRKTERAFILAGADLTDLGTERPISADLRGFFKRKRMRRG